MAGPIAIDTPDYQRGVTSAQKLLATVGAGVTNVTVGVPPNAETIIVTIPASLHPQQCSVQGVTTGIEYPGTLLLAAPATGGATTFFFDASQVMDEQLLITTTSLPTASWFVYADSGVHVVADLAKLTNSIGQQYVIPTVPSTATGDHPPNELQTFAAGFGSSGAVLNPPGGGKQYRLFALQLQPLAAGVFGAYVYSTGGNLMFSGTNGGAVVTYPLTGLPLGNNVGLSYTRIGAAGTEGGMVTYTTETI
jgi:hypothetical protein